MGSDIDFGLLRDIITAAIAILIYWIKRSMDKGVDEVKTSLTNINNNISTVVTLSSINNNLSNGAVTLCGVSSKLRFSGYPKPEAVSTRLKSTIPSKPRQHQMA